MKMSKALDEEQGIKHEINLTLTIPYRYNKFERFLLVEAALRKAAQHLAEERDHGEIHLGKEDSHGQWEMEVTEQ